LIAEVIVNYKSKSVDKVFDYAIPQELTDVIRVGSCVTVPFGQGNKIKEAYVLSVKEKSSAKKLKNILSISRDDVIFTDKQLELIKWIRERYFVTYLDAIRLVSPSGRTVFEEEYILLLNSNAKGDTANKIINILSENGGEVEINRLKGYFEGNILGCLSTLKKNGNITSVFHKGQAVTDKIIRVAEVCLDDDAVPEILKKLEKSNALAQAKMLDILSSTDRLSLSDLVHFSGGSYSAIAALLKKGYIRTYDVTVLRELPFDENEKEEPKTLTIEQSEVLSKLKLGLDNKKYQEYLLHGVTGSGKTEVYLRVIREVLNNNKQAIVLVPEISLTPQIVARFRRRFGNNVAIIHSGLSMAERYDQWKKIKNGDANIVVGARSAIFAPLTNIGAIIIDEEHEQSYKSDMTPRYETHEVCEFIARQHNAILVLASATPLINTYYKAKTNKIELLEMKHRFNNNKMPNVEVIDMRQELEDGNRSIFSRRLTDAIAQNLENRKQTILFLNRRGFSTFVSCRKCGFVPECPNCSISLTYHKFSETLKCHYCGHTIKNYTVCPECGSSYIRYFGGGTQKVEEEIHKLFPTATTIRMDIDTTGKKNSHEQILSRFEKENIDILIGTQMVTKGLDFPNVTLVGVVSADTMLNIDDYRSKERTFSILEQVTGRAGRHDTEGLSIIQTYNPFDSSIMLMQKHDYISFYKSEIAIRKAMWYPPFCEIAAVIFSGKLENITSRCAKFFAKNIADIKEIDNKAQILGPIPAYISKIKNKYIYRILIKCENTDNITDILSVASEKCRKNAAYENVSIVIDKNPNNMG